jgi:hypothetical protein
MTKWMKKRRKTFGAASMAYDWNYKERLVVSMAEKIRPTNASAKVDF